MSQQNSLQRDISAKDERPTNTSVEIVQPAGVVEKLDILNDHIECDHPVMQSQINDVREAMNKMVVPVADEDMSVAEIRNNPTAKIWQEVMQGNYKNIQKMTVLTNKVAEKLAASPLLKILNLDGLTQLPVEQAKILAKFNNILTLNGLSQITDEQANVLAGAACLTLSLSGVTHITEKQTKALSGYKGHRLMLNGLTHMTDEQARIFGGYQMKGALELKSIPQITRKSADYLVPIMFKIECKPIVSELLNNAYSRLKKK